jgi:hypothetical protein
MSVFDTAAASLAADPNIGAEAIYTPEGEAPLALRVTWGREEAPILGMGHGIVAGGTYCHIQAAIVPDRPRKGELISIGALDFIIETSELDPSSATWRCLLRAG